MKPTQLEKIRQHGYDLMRIFDLPSDTDPVRLCKLLRRLESRAHRAAEDWCNGEMTESQNDRITDDILEALDQLLGYKAKGIPVFINGDPRGYALKIEDDYVREHALQIHRDWGGYGILAPEID